MTNDLFVSMMQRALGDFQHHQEIDVVDVYKLGQSKIEFHSSGYISISFEDKCAIFNPLIVEDCIRLGQIVAKMIEIGADGERLES